MGSGCCSDESCEVAPSVERDWKRGPPPPLVMAEVEEVDIFQSAQLGWIERVKSLLAGPDGPQLLTQYNKSKETALHVACASDQPEVIEYLVMSGCPLGIPTGDDKGHTPIHKACEGPNINALNKLLELGADIDSTDKNLATPLIRAAQTNQALTASVLIGKGCNRHAVDKNGDSALHWAVNKGFGRLTLILIGAGLDIDLPDNYRQRPIHLAVVAKEYDICRHLVLQGVSATAEDSNGNTPLALAKKKGQSHQAISLLLQNMLTTRKNNPFGYSLVFDKQHFHRHLFQFTLWTFIFGFVFYAYKMFPLLGTDPLHQMYIGVELVAFAGFVWMATSNPGKQMPSPANHDEYEKSFKQIGQIREKEAAETQLLRLCHICRLVSQDRVYHCVKCNSCVPEFDRHSDMVMNCVGKNNRVAFMLFSVAYLLARLLALYWVYQVYQSEQLSYYVLFMGFINLVNLYRVARNSDIILIGIRHGLTVNERANPKRYYNLHAREKKHLSPYDNGLLRNLKWLITGRSQQRNTPSHHV